MGLPPQSSSNGGNHAADDGHRQRFWLPAFLHPGIVFQHPKDVVACLTLAEKRAILASWASDASALASCPALRAPEGLKEPVTFAQAALTSSLCSRKRVVNDLKRSGRN